jgi:DNA-binding beta-propeller fold protein YncE
MCGLEENEMLRGRKPALIGLLALAFVLPAPLQAGKKKAATAPPVNPADQRVKAYFDITKIVWPSPPEIPRVAFKEIYTGQKIDPNLFTKKARKKTWMDRLAGSLPADQVQMDKLPFQLIRTYGVGVDSKGKIYAADQGVAAVFIFDPQNKGHVELIGNGRQATFGLIAGVALDDDDRLFVVDVSLHHVVVFSPKHAQEAVFGADVLVRPAGVAIDRENRFVYVADTGNDVVDVFDADSYKLLRQIGKPSKKHDQTSPGLFSLPEGVALDSDGNVYVTDTFNDRIEIFDADGQFISTFGKNGDGPANFERPKGIAIDCDGHIWVVDATQNRVKVFSNQGRLLIYFGGAGYYPGQFMGPWGIAIGPSNQVVVSETYPGRVQIFRYITDAEAAAEKARREAAEKKAAVAPASTRQDAGATKPANVATAEPKKTEVGTGVVPAQPQKPASAATTEQKKVDVGAGLVPAQAQKPASAGPPEQKKPATEPPQVNAGEAAKKDSGAP